MITTAIPSTLYCHMGGSGTWGTDFPEALHMPGVSLLRKDMEFVTPFGVTVPMKLYHLDGSITIDHQERDVLYVPFHGKKTLAMKNSHVESVFYILKKTGVKYILADGSCGGVSILLEPGDIVCPSDFIDYTKRGTSVEDFCPFNIRMRDVINPDLRRLLYETASKHFPRVFRRGVCAISETPRFETAAEVKMYRQDGCDYAQATMLPEAALARAIEAEYAALYLVSNHAEGIDPDWERPLSAVYKECAIPMGKLMIEAMASINPESIRDTAKENILGLADGVKERILHL